MEWGENFNRLTRDITDRPLVLFIGAGVTYPLTPLWGELLACLLTRAFDHYRQEFGPVAIQQLETHLREGRTLSSYEQAHLVKLLLGKRYLFVLRQVIAEGQGRVTNDPKKVLAANPFLDSVVSLCNRQKVPGIVTYNYDDLLEWLLSPNAYSVAGQVRNQKSGGLPIYHVHGYLSRWRSVPDDEEAAVVLSLDEYFSNMLDPYSWQTTTQLHFLLNTTCLFLGASLDDINMLRMLDYANRHSGGLSAYALMARESFSGFLNPAMPAPDRDATADLLIKCRATLLGSVGVRMILVDKFGNLPECVRDLAK